MHVPHMENGLISSPDLCKALPKKDESAHYVAKCG